MFWRLGFTTAWRNLSRSMLALLSMALAAGFLTYVVSLSRGYPQLYRTGYRALIGGEISAYSLKLNMEAALTDQPLRYQYLMDVESTDLIEIMPEMRHSGYLSYEKPYFCFSEDDIERMDSLPDLVAVYPRYQVPALTSGHSSLRSTPLRGRDLELDARQRKPLSEMISAGRWFNEEDEGQLVAVVSYEQDYAMSQRPSGVGDVIQVLVPRIAALAEGSSTWSYDYSDPLQVELRVIGLLDIPSRSIIIDGGGEESSSSVVELFIQNNEIHLPLSTWQEIWRRAGGKEFQPQQLSLMVEDLSYLEDIVADLRIRFPQYSFFGVPEILDKAEPTFRIENPEVALIKPELISYIAPRASGQQSVLALDMRLPISMLILVNAALIVASNLLILVNERRREIGILKAIGASRKQIMEMILCEALLISDIGALTGFAFFRIPGLLNQLTNHVPLSSLLIRLFLDLILVVGTASLAAVVFGLLPALTMAKMPVQEVLQGE